MKRLLLALILVISSIYVYAQDYEIWGTFKVGGPLNDKWRIEVEGEDRYNFDAGNIRY